MRDLCDESLSAHALPHFPAQLFGLENGFASKIRNNKLLHTFGKVHTTKLSSIFGAEDRFLQLHDETDHYLISLPMENPTGEGFRIGIEGNIMKEVIGCLASYLKRIMSNRKVIHPDVKTWRSMLLSAEYEWIEYKGLWRVKSLLENESGPSGSKWDRPHKGQPSKPRVRWARPLEWLAELEKREQKKKNSS